MEARFWRETAGANTATYVEVREPEEGQYYTGATRWWTNGGADYVKWDDNQMFVGTGGFGTHVNDGWTYHKGDYVETWQGILYYKV